MVILLENKNNYRISFNVTSNDKIDGYEPLSNKIDNGVANINTNQIKKVKDEFKNKFNAELLKVDNKSNSGTGKASNYFTIYVDGEINNKTELAKFFLDKMFDKKNGKYVVTDDINIEKYYVDEPANMNLNEQSALSCEHQIKENINTNDANTKIETDTAYSANSDISFIMEYTYYRANADSEWEIDTVECVGWYYGTPNPQLDKQYYRYDMKTPSLR